MPRHLRFPDSELLQLFGGRKPMIESSLLQKMIAESLHEAILELLKDRFSAVPRDVSRRLRDVLNEKKFRQLNKVAAKCGDIDGFRQALLEKLSSANRAACLEERYAGLPPSALLPPACREDAGQHAQGDTDSDDSQNGHRHVRPVPLDEVHDGLSQGIEDLQHDVSPRGCSKHRPRGGFLQTHSPVSS
jgi:hypothetical protein